jgi:hypothetical protein
MGGRAPMLMLAGDSDGYGARWMIDGYPVEPAIARWLMESGYIASSGTTELGVGTLALTESGVEFLKAGALWWNDLSVLQKLKVIIFG